MLPFMKGGGSSEAPENTGPTLKWDGKTISVSLPTKDGKIIDAKWQPAITYVVRVRKAGDDNWSFGFEIPLTACSIVDLEPDTEYEMAVTSKNATGESEPVLAKARTNPTGELGNPRPMDE